MGAIEGTGFNGQHNAKVIASKRVKPLDDESRQQMEVRRRIEAIRECRELGVDIDDVMGA